MTSLERARALAERFESGLFADIDSLSDAEIKASIVAQVAAEFDAVRAEERIETEKRIAKWLRETNPQRVEHPSNDVWADAIEDWADAGFAQKAGAAQQSARLPKKEPRHAHRRRRSPAI